MKLGHRFIAWYIIKPNLTPSKVCPEKIRLITTKFVPDVLGPWLMKKIVIGRGSLICFCSGTLIVL